MTALIREGNARITLKFVLERDINDAAQDVREKVAQAHQGAAARGRAADHHEGRSRRGPGRQLRAVRAAAASRADGDRRQADPPRHRDGGRRRRGHHLRRPGARDPGHPRRREAQRARAHRRSRARRDRLRERRGARRLHPAGGRRADAAHARPARVDRASSRTSWSPRPRAARRSGCATSRRVEDTTAEARTAAFFDGAAHAGHGRAPPVGPEHRPGRRGGARQAGLPAPRAAARGEGHRHARRLPVHPRLDRVARGAPAARQPARQPRDHGVHPELPGRVRRVARDPGVDHRQLRAHPRRRLHAEQHDAARR